MQEKKSPFGIISEENIFIGQYSTENKLLTRKEVEVLFDTTISGVVTSVTMGTPSDITATSSNSVSGTTHSHAIAAAAITNAKLANMSVNTIKGRITAGTGAPEDLTASNIRTIINVADGANNYSHPTGDGNLHVPVTSTNNSGNILVAGDTAGSFSWKSPDVITAGSAETAWELTTSSAGSSTQPTYFANGVPVAISTTVGSTQLPIYSNAGVLTAATDVASKAVGTDINEETATLGSTHRNKFIRVIYTSGAVTLTIGTTANAGFSIGDEIHILRYSSQEVTIARAPGVSLYSEGSTTENAGKKRINAPMQVVTLKCTNTNVWVLFGALKE